MNHASRALLAMLVAGIGCVVVAGCSRPTIAPVDEAARAAIVPLEGTSWMLAELPGNGEVVGHPPTAQFGAGRVQGSDGCNRYAVPFAATGSAIRIDRRGPSTMMACPPDITAQAEAFMAALVGAAQYRIVDGSLELLSSNEAVLAIMSPQPTSLVGSWEVTGINNGRQAVVGVLSDGPVNMTFSADGKVAGSAGCNRFSAGFKVEGNSIHFTPAATTRRMCSQEGVMEQEQAFLSALAMVATVHMDGDSVELRGDDGALALLLRRAPG